MFSFDVTNKSTKIYTVGKFVKFNTFHVSQMVHSNFNLTLDIHEYYKVKDIILKNYYKKVILIQFKQTKNIFFQYN